MRKSTRKLTPILKPNDHELKVVINQICAVQRQGTRLMEKFSVGQLLNSIDSQKIAQIQKYMFDSKGRGDSVELVGFIKGMLKVVEHAEIETLYLVIALVDFFKGVQDAYELDDQVRLKDVTNFICDSQLNQDDGYFVKQKLVPYPKQIHPVLDRVRAIDVDPPVAQGANQDGITRLLNHKILTDNQHHKNQRVKNAAYLELKRVVVVLDSLSEKLDVYDCECVKKGEIHPAKGSDRNFIIIDFAFSNRQQRLGACLMDMSLCFWEAADDFKYCKIFGISSQVQHYQSRIWYLEHFQAWLTSDESNRVIQWDLEKELITRTVCTYGGQIVELQELPQQQLIAVATVEKYLYLIAFDTLNELQRIEFVTSINRSVTNGGIHTVRFSQQFQVLLVAGYCHQVKVYSLHQICHDANLEGCLNGHSTMISSMSLIRDSPMVVTADDCGIIKVWDLRSLQCLQTLSIGARTIMHLIMDMSPLRRIALVGIRLYMLRFEESQHFQQPQDLLYGLSVNFNFQSNELIVATRRDVRFYSIATGRLLRVLKNLLQEPDDEITTFKIVRMNKSFLVGNQRGAVHTHAFTGEIEEPQDGQAHEISQMKLDSTNKLFVVVSDCNVSIQSLHKLPERLSIPSKPHTLRELRRLHNGKFVTVLELSVYHNLIFTAAADKSILAFDYEFAKLVGATSLPEGHEPSALQCVNGYSMLLVGTNTGHFVCLQFHQKESGLKFRTLMLADVASLLSKQVYINRFICDVTGGNTIPTKELKLAAKPTIQNNGIREIRSFLLYLALSDGCIAVLDLSLEAAILVTNYIQHQPAAYTRLNYNAQRVIIEEVLETKVVQAGHQISLNATEASEPPLDFTDEKVIITQRRNSLLDPKSPRLSFSQLSTPMARRIINLETVMCCFKAHRDQITSVTLLELDTQYLITTSHDHYVKFWDVGGFQDAVKPQPISSVSLHESPTIKFKEDPRSSQQPTLTCSINLNHPLPSLWKLQDDQQLKEHRKVLFAMRAVDIMFKKFKDDIMPADERYLSLQPLFDYIQTSAPKLNLLRQPDPVVLMQDEYSQRDLPGRREMFRSELQGPSLKQLDKLKRLEMISLENAEKPSRNDLQAMIHNLNKAKDAGKDDDRYSFLFLSEENYRQKMVSSYLPQIKLDDPDYLYEFETRLKEYAEARKGPQKLKTQTTKKVTSVSSLPTLHRRHGVNADISPTTYIDVKIHKASMELNYFAHRKNPSVFSRKSKPSTHSMSQVFIEKQKQVLNESSLAPSTNMSKLTNSNASESFGQHRKLHDMLKCMNQKVLKSQRSMVKARFDRVEQGSLRTIQFDTTVPETEHEDRFTRDLNAAHAQISEKVKGKLQMLLQPRTTSNTIHKIKSVQDPAFEEKVELYQKVRKEKVKSIHTSFFTEYSK